MPMNTFQLSDQKDPFTPFKYLYLIRDDPQNTVVAEGEGFVSDSKQLNLDEIRDSAVNGNHNTQQITYKQTYSLPEPQYTFIEYDLINSKGEQVGHFDTSLSSSKTAPTPAMSLSGHFDNSEVDVFLI